MKFLERFGYKINLICAEEHNNKCRVCGKDISRFVYRSRSLGRIVCSEECFYILYYKLSDEAQEEIEKENNIEIDKLEKEKHIINEKIFDLKFR